MPPPTDLDAPPRRRPFEGPDPRPQPRRPEPDSPGEPRAPIDPRFRARRIEVRRDEGRRRLRRLAVLAGVVGLLLLVPALAFTPLADVDRIEVAGTFRTDPQDVVDAGGIDRGAPTLLADTAAAERRVAALPWVAEVRVVRSLPGTVRYVVTEREPRAVAATVDGRAAVLDAEGQVVQVLDGQADEVDLPLLSEVVVEARPGAVVPEDARVADLVEVAARLPGGLVPVVDQVRSDEQGVHLLLVPTGTVQLGDSEDLDDAFVALSSVLTAIAPSCVGAIDVSVPSAPVLTRVPGCQ